MNIAITGAKGVIGSVLSKGLTNYNIKEIDLPEIDCRNYNQLLPILQNQEVVIHLAWNTKTENIHSKNIDENNSTMYYTALQAALDAGVRRIILASSIHAESGKNVYGKHKQEMERIAKTYSKRELEVICIRFPNINRKNQQIEQNWLSHDDCINLVKYSIETKFSNNYAIVDKIPQ